MFQVPFASSGYDFDRLIVVVVVVIAAVALVVMIKRYMGDPTNLAHISIVTNDAFKPN